MLDAQSRGTRQQTRRPGNSDPEQQTIRPHTTQAQSRRSADQRPGCLQGTTPKSTSSEQLQPSPCPQSPAGPTGSLGQRQNTQQRGAAGLGETAFPGKTRPSRGLNYPIAAPETLASKTAKSKKGECELPLIGETQGQHNW